MSLARGRTERHNRVFLTDAELSHNAWIRIESGCVHILLDSWILQNAAISEAHRCIRNDFGNDHPRWSHARHGLGKLVIADDNRGNSGKFATNQLRPRP